VISFCNQSGQLRIRTIKTKTNSQNVEFSASLIHTANELRANRQLNSFDFDSTPMGKHTAECILELDPESFDAEDVELVAGECRMCCQLVIERLRPLTRHVHTVAHLHLHTAPPLPWLQCRQREVVLAVRQRVARLRSQKYVLPRTTTIYLSCTTQHPAVVEREILNG